MRFSLLFIWVFLWGIVSAGEFVPKAAYDYNEKCGCKYIFWYNHLESESNQDEPNFVPSTLDNFAANNSVKSNKLSSDGVLTFPDCIRLLMENSYSKLTGYYKTGRFRHFTISAEYVKAGKTTRLPTIQLIGNGEWIQFDYYFELDQVSGLDEITLNIQAPLDRSTEPATVVPVYIDEIRLCKFCNPNTNYQRPVLSNLDIFIDGINTDIGFNANINDYLIKAESSNLSVQVKPVSPNSTIIVQGQTVPSGTLSDPYQMTLSGNSETEYIITVKDQSCGRNVYILKFISSQEICDATLKDVVFCDPENSFLPQFFSKNNYEYIILMPEISDSLCIVPYPSDYAASLSIRGQKVLNEVSTKIDISSNKIFDIIVTGSDNITQKTYYFSVDNLPTISFNEISGSGSESLSDPIIPVRVFPSPAANQTVTVDYTVTGTATGGGADYTLADGTLSFDISNLTQNIPLVIVDDLVSFEGDETVVITLSNPNGGALLGDKRTFTYTIQDNDRIIFVKKAEYGGNDDNTGYSWEQAKENIETALVLAHTLNPSAGNEIEVWVGAGIYRPQLGMYALGPGITNSFVLQQFVNLIGGFPADGGYLSMKNCRINETILSGDLDNNDGTDWPKPLNEFFRIDDERLNDNSNNVVYGESNATIDGFIIENGFSRCYEHCDDQSGGGMIIKTLQNPRVLNCKFRFNITEGFSGGGAVYCLGSPIFSNCTFSNNFSTSNGGAVYSFERDISFVNCLFTDNITAYNGGGIYGADNIEITNCSFINNIADLEGGGLYISSTNTHIVNSILDSNVANTSDIMYPSNGIWVLFGYLNSMSYSRIQEPWTENGGNNISAPSLITPDHHLIRTSPCYNSGDPSTNNSWFYVKDQNGYAIDLDGLQRFYGPLIDMGSFELQE